ncbi:hypothetical protein RchiOBHm_Chr2g0168491 [Rosa chinensis]|uniref:Uncharacterized protein n=1 Tax=Rosa chinensis TaxID=74649 RepID=A0A2P6S4L8_ROSCH|nr:hypothetical protein RchiOBHm_Chr2g0168491 [Rosa chinensis]
MFSSFQCLPCLSNSSELFLQHPFWIFHKAKNLKRNLYCFLVLLNPNSAKHRFFLLVLLFFARA